MAKLILESKCAEAALLSYLKKYFHRITAGTETSVATVSFATVIGEFKFKLRCEFKEPSNRLHIALTSPMGTGLLLTFKRGSIMKQYPFIEKLAADECVIDFDKIEYGGLKLSDWIDVRSVHIPGAEGAFCTAEFAVKENA